MIEQNQNITRQYAVAYAILALNKIQPNTSSSTCEELGKEMIKLMRVYKGKQAVKQANKILEKF